MTQELHPQDLTPERSTTQPKVSPDNLSLGPNQLTDKELHERYFVAIRELADDAIQRRKARVFIEAIAWEVSRLIDGLGLIVAGDFLQRLGHAVYARADVRLAQAEAEEAARDGHKPS